MREETGKVIAIEGLDFTGKSTCVPLIAELLRKRRGVEVITTRAPGGTAIGTQIRSMLHSEGLPIGDPYTREFLHMADMNELFATTIVPAVRAGTWVIADRLIDSTRAYAVGGLGLDEDRIEDLIAAASASSYGYDIPHQVIWFACPVETTMARMAAGGGPRDTSDAKGELFRHRVHDWYSRAYQQYEWWDGVDATLGTDACAESALAFIGARFPNKAVIA